VKPDRLLLLTGVPAVMRDFGTPHATELRHLGLAQLTDLHLPDWSMGPKIDACAQLSTVRGKPSAIGALTDAAAVLAGTAGTTVTTRPTVPTPAPVAPRRTASTCRSPTRHCGRTGRHRSGQLHPALRGSHSSPHQPRNSSRTPPKRGAPPDPLEPVTRLLRDLSSRPGPDHPDQARSLRVGQLDHVRAGHRHRRRPSTGVSTDSPASSVTHRLWCEHADRAR